ncbi:MAG: hypothetical protein JWO13_2757 [Acidobacteriales bacterium]|nr:hypothetical protein [Terriglobales bacterium]
MDEQPLISPRLFSRLQLLVLLVPALATTSSAQARATEYQVKAAYLYNFGKFVSWPPAQTNDGDSFGVCVLGKDPFGSSLDATIANATVANKKIVAKRITSADEAVGCRIVFIGNSEAARLEKLLPSLNKMGALTVSDIPRFINRGGMIQFVLNENRIRFEVNLTPAETAGLTLSSELLKVAASVKRISAPGGAQP